MMVATLIAGPGFALNAALCDRIKHALEPLAKQKISIRWLDEGRAVDIFFDSSPLAGEVRWGGTPPSTEGRSCGTPPPLAPPASRGESELFVLQSISQILGDAPVDILIQPAAHRRKKFLIADMESTVIEQEMLDELAGMIGQRELVADITKRAMNGELDFAAALRARVVLLKGRPATLLDEAAQRITYMQGAAQLLKAMKAGGAICWLVSGGFTCFAEPVEKHLGFDAVHANNLIVKDGVITGEIAEPILDKTAKRRLLMQACGEMNLSLEDCLAIGDGANDIPMLTACNEGGGLGVAYHAKPKVREVIAPQINFSDLSALVYAQGLTSSSRT